MTVSATNVSASKRGSIRKDGFVFHNTDLDRKLYSYLYESVPEGKRRDQMKRLMLLGLVQELGIELVGNDYIPVKAEKTADDALMEAFKNDFIGIDSKDDKRTTKNKRSGNGKKSTGTGTLDVAKKVQSEFTSVKNDNINVNRHELDDNAPDMPSSRDDGLVVLRVVQGVARSVVDRFKD